MTGRRLRSGAVLDAVDLALGLALVVMFVVTSADAVAGPGQRPPDAVAVLLGLAATAPVVARRRWPLATLVITALGVLGYVLREYPEPVKGFGMLICLYSVAVYRGRRRAAVGLCLAGAVVVVGAGRVADQTFTESAFNLVILVTACSLGDGVRSRRAQAGTLAAHAAQLEREQEQRAELAVTAERVRIARELHDVVAHSMSIVAVQATVGSHVFDTDPATAKRALATIETTTRDGLVEMRRLLGVLRTGEVEQAQRRAAGGELHPQPRLKELDRLVQGVSSAGLQADLVVEGTPQGLSAGAELTIYRVIQEALTNVIKHARATRVQVRLSYSASRVVAEVVDDGRSAGRTAPAVGHGLIGMRERAGSVGGQVSAGRRPEGGFAVRLCVPLDQSTLPAVRS